MLAFKTSPLSKSYSKIENAPLLIPIYEYLWWYLRQIGRAKPKTRKTFLKTNCEI